MSLAEAARRVPLGPLAAAALLVALFSIRLPATPTVQLCGFHWLTGRPCPLCGLTRAVFALAKGHWREAVRFNALSPLGLAMLFSLFWDNPLRRRLWTAGIAAFAIYGVFRILN
ncbi:MAG TPA: DUF2752 domain-containing protein [Bryobacteraceae bacterium]|nr:DUF2752 domain-containing protein [Bryobacteraceae bacterium]